MKHLLLLGFTCLFLQPGFCQKYENQEAFQYYSIELNNGYYHLYEQGCIGSSFSRGTYFKKGDTLFFTSQAIYDDRLLRVIPKWQDGRDSVMIQIKTFTENEKLSALRISIVGDDSIFVTPNENGIVTLPLSILPVNEIWINQKRCSVFIPANSFTVYYDRPYDSHFVGMLNEPFIMSKDNIYADDTERWGYFFVTKVEKLALDNK